MIGEPVLQVLKTSLLTSLLIALLLALTPLLRRRYRARWRYAAWLLIALRLLVPFDITLPGAPVHIELPERAAAAAPLPTGPAGVPDTATEPGDESPPVPAAFAAEAASAGPALSPIQAFGILWVAGMTLFLLFQAGSYQRFLRRLKRSGQCQVPPQIREAVAAIGSDMGIRRLPEPLITDAIEAPVLIGVLRPRILLPHTRYGDEELAFILRHELVHYSRRDMWYKLVLLLANGVHWFNPLVYLMTIQAAKDIELACDDDVAKTLDRDARARYGQAILAALPRKGRLEPVFSTHFGSAKKTMKSRLKNLFDGAGKRRGVAALLAVAICAATVTGIATVGYAADTARLGLAVDVDVIEAGQAICVGQIRLDGTYLSYDVSAASGRGLFVAMNASPDITTFDNAVWKKWTAGNYENDETGRLVQSVSVPSPSGKYYVYVGSKDGQIKEVKGTIQFDGSLLSQTPAIPAITEEHAFSVESIDGGEVVCLGKLELEPGVTYSATLSVKSGGSVMMGLYDKPDATRSAGIGWDQSFGGTDSSILFSSDVPRTTYVYVGSNDDKGRLTGLSGSIRRNGAVASQDTAKPLVDRRISASAVGGTWSAASLVGGNSYRAQLDDMIDWLDRRYKEKNTAFVITETVPESELTNTAGIRYLHETSQTYRTMSAMKNGSFPVRNSESFSRSSIPEAKAYDRTVVMVDKTTDLALDVSYSLERGRMAVWLVSPSGKTVHKGELERSLTTTMNIAGEKGLWSVVTVSEPVSGMISGSCRMTLRTAGTAGENGVEKGEEKTPATAAADTSFAVQRLGQHTIRQGDSVQASLQWDGGGQVIVLYTDRDYTGNELLVPLQGLPGIPTPDYDKVDREKTGSSYSFNGAESGTSRSFSFTMSKSPLEWDYSSTKPGSYWFYLLVIDGPENISGSVSTVSATGAVNSIWSKTGRAAPDSEPAAKGDQTVVSLTNGGGRSITQSGSFEAKSGQSLVLTVQSDIKGGVVDFFLFPPSGKEQRITLSGSSAQTIPLSAGRWSYNCTGFFTSGDITIVGKLA